MYPPLKRRDFEQQGNGHILYSRLRNLRQSPSLDRPAQFAGVRTDMDFNIIEEPLVIYCAPADDYLPEPEAVMITGITPAGGARQRR